MAKDGKDNLEPAKDGWDVTQQRKPGLERQERTRRRDSMAVCSRCDGGWQGNDCSVVKIAPTPPPAPIDCVLGDWGEWPPKASCTGQFQRRVRKITVQAAYGGKECVGSLSESRACGEHCKTTAWGEWGNCAPSTGPMSRSRSRDPSDTDANKPCFFLVDTVNCSVSCSVGDCTLRTDTSEAPHSVRTGASASP